MSTTTQPLVWDELLYFVLLEDTPAGRERVRAALLDFDIDTRPQARQVINAIRQRAGNRSREESSARDGPKNPE